MQRILGIGECMVELSGEGNPLLKKAFAGDVLNTLWYAKASFGVTAECAFFSGVGADPLSRQMIEFIESADIDCSDVLIVPERRPGLYMIHLDGAERSFSYWRENSAARLLATDRELLQDAIEKASAVYFSGITLAILSEADRQYLINQMGQARLEGKLVAFDPNIRPSLWANSDDMKSALMEAADCSNILMPSFDDEANAFGDSSPKDTLKRYSTNSDTVVVVKDGAGDVLVSKDTQSYSYATALVDNAVDTTGAGDSFNGAFLARYSLGGDVANAVKAGQQCAGQVICHPGALVPHDQLKLMVI